MLRSHTRPRAPARRRTSLSRACPAHSAQSTNPLPPSRCAQKDRKGKRRVHQKNEDVGEQELSESTLRFRALARKIRLAVPYAVWCRERASSSCYSGLCDRNVVAAMTTTMRDARATVPPSALYSRLPNPSRIRIIFAVAKHVKNPYYVRGCQTRQENERACSSDSSSQSRLVGALQTKNLAEAIPQGLSCSYFDFASNVPAHSEKASARRPRDLPLWFGQHRVKQLRQLIVRRRAFQHSAVDKERGRRVYAHRG